jgi:transcriptional regulator with XRE-family HTH domain
VKGKELRAIRDKLRWTQVQLAEVLGVTPNTVARWERDEVEIREPMARLIQSVYSTEKKKGVR